MQQYGINPYSFEISHIVCMYNICTYIYTYILIFHVSTGCPRIVRADHGTENALVAEMQIAFRFNHTDSLAGEKSFLYGPSTANIVSSLRGCHIYVYTYFKCNRDLWQAGWLYGRRNAGKRVNF